MKRLQCPLRPAITLLLFAWVAGAPAPGTAQVDTTLTFPVVVETGNLFVYGHQIDPPYVFEIVGGDTLEVNGIRVCPTYNPVPRRPPVLSDLNQRQRTALGEVSKKAGRLSAAGHDKREVLDSAAVFLRGYPELFDSVRVYEKHGLWIWRVGESHGEQIGFEDPRRPPPSARRGPFQENVGSWKRALESGGVLVIMACGGAISIQPARAAAMLAEINAARSMSPEEAQEYPFRHLNPLAARQFASPVVLPMEKGARR